MEEKETTKKRRKKGAGSIMRKANGTYLGRIAISGYEPFLYWSNEKGGRTEIRGI